MVIKVVGLTDKWSRPIILLSKHKLTPSPFSLPIVPFPLSPLDYGKLKYKQTKISLNFFWGFRMSESPLKRWPVPEGLENKSLKTETTFLSSPVQRDDSQHTQNTHTSINWFPIKAHLLWKQMNILTTCDNLSIYFWICWLSTVFPTSRSQHKCP